MKKIILLCLMIIPIISLTACDTQLEEIGTEIVENQNNIEDIPFDITKEELLSFDWQQSKEFIETNIPNYREVFIIDADKELTEDDWIALRNILSISLFKSAVLETPEEEPPISNGEDEITEIIANNYDGVAPEIKKEIQNYMEYGFITKQDVDNMSMDEFKEFLPKYYSWALGSDAGYELSFGILTQEEWISCKENLAHNLSDANILEDTENK